MSKGLLQGGVALVVTAVALLAMNWLIVTKPDVPKQALSEKAYPVESSLVHLGIHSPTISAFGEVTAGRTVELRSLVAGEVIAVNPALKVGGMVSKGDMLVKIDPFEYEGALTEAKADLAEAEAKQVENKGQLTLERENIKRSKEQLEFAQKDLKRATELVERGSGAISEQSVDERKLLVSQREQAQEQNQNTLALYEAKVAQQDAAIKKYQWGVQNAERQLNNTVLYAPFDAVVREQGAEAGRLVSVNDAVASIYSNEELEVRFTLSDNEYGRIVSSEGTVVGRPVDLLWNIGTDPIVYHAKVDRVAADVDSTHGGVDIYAVVDYDQDKPPLRPGAFVQIQIPDQAYPETFRIPENAVYGDGLVYVIKDGRLQAKQVSVQAYDGNTTIVRGGLENGDELLTTRLAEAGNGLLVKSTRPAEDVKETGSLSRSGDLSGASQAKG
ncbi:efflux RND transporter periplasmic adaptor subunit [Roseibium sp. RKSG952]|uniref:efflux RND transporter periplasmic adaptor subunit n=1 Tax=Roseibium sp. RKSG952 TaxID=2529384 RepID=UPI0018AD12B9